MSPVNSSEPNEVLNTPFIGNNGEEIVSPPTSNWKHHVRVAAPHIAILLAVLVYVLIGAIIFHELEYEEEVHAKETGIQRVEKAKREFEATVWNLTFSSPELEEYEWRIVLQKQLADFSQTIFYAMRDNYLEHSELFGGAKKDLWNYQGAVLFSFATITTIGYGNIVPMTTRGRAFCMLYALIGIPLGMTAIANVGKFLAESVTYLMEYREHLWLRFIVTFQNSQCIRKFGLQKLIEPFLPSERNHLYESNPSYFCCITLSCIITTRGYKNSPIWERRYYEELIQMELYREWISQMVSPDGDRDRPPPIKWFAFIAIVYLAVAAAILPLWEQLDLFTAFYFSFITITTTGFGDIVPGNLTYLPLTLVFLGLGIAITTMCVELVSNAMRKLHYTGRPVKGTREDFLHNSAAQSC